MLYRLIACLVAYLVGSLPTGYWYAKYLFGVDVTKVGSGNIGATNVARALGSNKHFAIIWFIDAAKAYLYLFVLAKSGALPTSTYALSFLLLSGALLLIGNGHSVFLGMRGGKGIATTTGILFFIFPYLGLLFALLSITLMFCLRTVDKAVLVTTLVVSGTAIASAGIILPDVSLFFIFLTFWLFYRHTDNLKRIMR